MEENPYFCPMKKAFLPILVLLLMLSCQQQPEVVIHDGIPFTPMKTKRLPDLNEARSGHALVWAGDHILAIGGHTTGFIPIATAEYYEGGRWHAIATLYSHDTPFALVLNDGDVLVGGGYESIFGVGQTWGVECYHPATHSFTPKPIMDKKRAHASALELEDGMVVISGNWYTTDFTEIFDSTGNNLWTDSTSYNRSYPFILPIEKDNAWIIGGKIDSYNNTPQNIVDQLKGEPFEVDLLSEWHPQTPLDRNVQADTYRVSEHAFLIPASNKDGQFAPVLVNNSGFSLLPMEQALPIAGPWGTIKYFGSFWTSPETETAWLMGFDKAKRVCLAEIQYGQALQGGKAKLDMHFSQPLEELPSSPWEMRLPDGSFVIVGGNIDGNYNPSAATFAFFPDTKPQNHFVMMLWCIGLAVVALVVFFVIQKTWKRKPEKDDASPAPEKVEETVPSNAKQDFSDKLIALMEENQLFRNKDLCLADVAAALGTNTSYLSACLNGTLNTTFPAFVMGYRVRYAQKLMRDNPSMRLSQVAEESGFANEKTFLRSFKAICGVTPSEWKQQFGSHSDNNC